MNHNQEQVVADILQTAHEAADQAGHVMMELLGTAQVGFKGAVDLVTEADTRAEYVITQLVRAQFPGHVIMGEESGVHWGETDEDGQGPVVRWHIDPIDGTTNYAHGFPFFATSIGVEVDGEMTVGIINNPAYNERYVAVKGKGAYLNGRRLQVSKSNKLIESLLVTGFPYSLHDHEHNNTDHFLNFVRESRGMRRLGSAALDLAMVARGSFDGYWEPSLNAWDMAAGYLLVKEAGGKVTDLKGNPFHITESAQILATNGHIHEAMLEVLAKGKTGL